MSEWQPARVVFSHGTGELNPAQIASLKAMIIRVRAAWKSEFDDESGCPAGSKTFEVHPDDSRKIWPSPKGMSLLCEHEILTD